MSRSSRLLSLLREGMGSSSSEGVSAGLTRAQVWELAAQQLGLESRMQLKRGLHFLRARNYLVTRAPAEKRAPFTYHLNGEQPKEGLGVAPKVSKATKKRAALQRKKMAKQRR